MEVETHPNPQPHPYHRKIELQSALDLAYLQSNIARAAREKLDLHFPKIPPPATHIPLDGPSSNTSQTYNKQDDPSPEDEADPMRAGVHSLVTQFLHQTWSHACQSISINGLDATSLPTTITPGQNSSDPSTEREGIDYTYTPFDPTLQRRLASLHAEVEHLTTQVSKLRRVAPAQAAENYGNVLREQMEEDETKRRRRQQLEQTKNILDLQHLPDGWTEDVSRVYERGLIQLRRLRGLEADVPTDLDGSAADEGGIGVERHSHSLTETVGKVQRARTVVLELER